MEATMTAVSALITTMVAFTALILAHEWGHAVAASWCGARPSKIKAGNLLTARMNIAGVPHELGMVPFMGRTWIPELARLGRTQRIWVSAAGVLVSALLGGLLLAVGSLLEWKNVVHLGWASIAIGLMNLIPFPGLDGWAILKEMKNKN